MFSSSRVPLTPQPDHSPMTVILPLVTEMSIFDDNYIRHLALDGVNFNMLPHVVYEVWTDLWISNNGLSTGLCELCHGLTWRFHGGLAVLQIMTTSVQWRRRLQVQSSERQLLTTQWWTALENFLPRNSPKVDSVARPVFFFFFFFFFFNNQNICFY